MKYTDIVVVGGGLAGSIAAVMLGRAGIATVVIDPHETYLFDFRVEKLSGDTQLERFFGTGIADLVLRSATHGRKNRIARFGHLLDKRPSRQFGISYENLIGAIRLNSRIPQGRFTPRRSRPSYGGHATGSAASRNFAPVPRQHLQCRPRPDRDHDAVNAGFVRGGESRCRKRLRSFRKRS